MGPDLGVPRVDETARRGYTPRKTDNWTELKKIREKT